MILRYIQEHEDWRMYLTENVESSYDIDANFSLIIQNVTIDNEDVYYCDVFDLDTGKVETNEIDVAVFGKLTLSEYLPYTNIMIDSMLFCRNVMLISLKISYQQKGLVGLILG